MVEKKGIFICIEGLDGSGKTTQAKILAKKINNAIYTTEPSKGLIGNYIRKSYLYSKKRFSPFVEALLFAADRIEHLESEIIPALNEGTTVICDRYVFSSLAYQGASGISLDWIETINKAIIYPDLAIFIDVEPEKSMRRLNSKKSLMENLQTQIKVRDIYLKFVEDKKLTLVNGDNPKTKVTEDLFSIVKNYFN